MTPGLQTLDSVSSTKQTDSFHCFLLTSQTKEMLTLSRSLVGLSSEEIASTQKPSGGVGDAVLKSTVRSNGTQEIDPDAGPA